MSEVEVVGDWAGLSGGRFEEGRQRGRTVVGLLLLERRRPCAKGWCMLAFILSRKVDLLEMEWDECCW